MQNEVHKSRLKQALDPSALALNSIAFLAADPTRLERFCALSGMLEADLRNALNSPQFHGFVLDYLLQDESLLLAFAGEQGVDPASILQARRKLPGFAE